MPTVIDQQQLYQLPANTGTTQGPQTIATPAGPTVVLPQQIAQRFAQPPPPTLSVGPSVAIPVGPVQVKPQQSAIPFQTALAPADEVAFQKWVKTNKIPFDPSPQADYDMRGYWLAQKSGDPRASQDPKNKHFPDTWKTPYHATFSNESIYATPLAPHWDGPQLKDWRGNVLADETPRGIAGESTDNKRSP